jgi:5-methylthioadenosine/S-adenosylhomocysteine deaminase
VPGFVNAHYHSHDAMLKGMFEEMPFDIWALHTNAASYGRRSHQEIRLRTLIGAAEMLRNGITTVQDFLTLVPAEEAYLDTILSAYEEAGIRVVVGLAARDRAALDIAPLMAMDLPQSIRDRLTGTSRPAKQELDFIEAQMRRLGMNPRPLMTWAITPSAPQRCSPELLEGTKPPSVHPRLRDAAAGRRRSRAVSLAARYPQARGPDERAAQSRARRLARIVRYRHAGRERRPRGAQSDQQSEAQERHGADSRSA